MALCLALLVPTALLGRVTARRLLVTDCSSGLVLTAILSRKKYKAKGGYLVLVFGIFYLFAPSEDSKDFQSFNKAR